MQQLMDKNKEVITINDSDSEDDEAKKEEKFVTLDDLKLGEEKNLS